MAGIEYAPSITKAKTLQVFVAGDYLALLLGKIKSEGPVEYLYVLSVFRAEDNELCLCVASEKNNVPLEGAGAHFLGVFRGTSHENLGLSDDWADREKFTAKALSIAKERLGISEDPVEVQSKRPWWKFWRSTV
jgi:hypothetical protein